MGLVRKRISPSPSSSPRAGGEEALDLGKAAATSAAEVLEQLDTSAAGLSGDEAARRLALDGPNVLRSHGARPFEVLLRQLKSYLLLLLVGAAVLSAIVGDRTEAGIILGIVALSVGLGFVNEYRSEKAVEALHSRIRRRILVERGGRAEELDITVLVPGDVVSLRVGDVVPADLRLLEVNGLECEESVLTGESGAAAKSVEAVAAGTSALGSRAACRPRCSAG